MVAGLACAVAANSPWVVKLVAFAGQERVVKAFGGLTSAAIFGGNLLAIVLLGWSFTRMLADRSPARRMATTLQRRGDYGGSGEMYLRAGDLKRAMESFKKARAWPEAARAASGLGRNEEAADLLRKAGKDHLPEAARLYSTCGREDDARECFQAFAEWKMSQNRFADAIPAWLRAGEPMRATHAALVALDHRGLLVGTSEFNAARHAAESTRHHSLLARLAEEESDFATAAQSWAASGDHLRAAEDLIRLDRFQEAAKQLDRAGKPREATQLLFRALDRLLQRLQAAAPGPASPGNLEAVRAEADDLARTLLPRLKKHGMDGEYLEALQGLGRTDEATRWLIEHGRTADAADIAYRMQRWDLAAPLLKELRRWGEASDVYELAGDLVSAGRCAELAEEDERALAIYRQLGDRAAAARCLAHLGQVQEALKELNAIGKFEEAWDLLRGQPGPVPDIPDVILDLAHALRNEGRLHDAIACLQRAVVGVALGPAKLEPALALARLLMAAGDLPAAKAQVQRILDFDYSFAPAQQLHLEIQELLGAGSPADTRPPAAAPPASLPTAPDTPRYETLTELGRGGMGVVFKAVDRRLERVVAIKVLRTTSVVEAERLRQEAKAAATLNHPSIVTVYDFEEGMGSYLIAMEYVDGEPLDQVLRKDPGRVSSRLVNILRDLADAVAYAHDHHVVHRDLKPGNILLTTDDRVKMFDFGIAARLDADGSEPVKVCGTPFYMAPEQIRGEIPTPSSDIYSLGATFFHIATGKPPFYRGNILEAHLKTPPPDPHELRPGLPPGLGRIILHCLEKDPARRYPNAHELHRDLLQI